MRAAVQHSTGMRAVRRMIVEVVCGAFEVAWCCMQSKCFVVWRQDKGQDLSLATQSDR